MNKFITTVIVSAFVLTGCGGSSGGSDDTTTPPPVTNPTPEPTPEPATQCVVSDVPHYGTVSNLGTATNLESLQSLPNTEDQVFTLHVNSGEYGFFAYPAALGKARFYDTNLLDIEGGWEGATWPSDGSIGSNYDPVVVTIDDTEWFVHRTDFPGIGTIDYRVEFPNAGAAIGDSVDCDNSAYPSEDQFNYGWADDITDLPEVPSEPETPTIPEGQCLVSDVPRFGTSSTNIDFALDIDALASEMPNTDDGQFTLNVTGSEYGFFAYPAALGEATFIDNNIMLEGGWDGATWSDDGSTIGDKYTPIVIEKDGTKWFVYRTDFSGIGNIDYSVKFENAGAAVGSIVDCTTSSFPETSKGNVIGDSSVTNVFVYAQGSVDTLLEIGIVADGEWQVNATDLPDGTYDMYFVVDNGGSDLPSYGPATMTVIGGEISETDFDTSVLTSSTISL